MAASTIAPVHRRAIALAVLCLTALACALPAQARAATVVSLTFDDGTVSQLYAKDRLAERGLRGTFFINSGNVQAPNNPYFMTWGQVASVAAAGNEIGGHSLNDLNLVTGFTNDSARRDAICNDRANLIAHGFNPVSFAYPHGAYNAQIISLVQQCGYASARTAGGLNEPGFPYTENIPPVKPYELRTNQPHVGPMTLAELQGYVIRAGGSGWVPLMFHDICAPLHRHGPRRVCEPGRLRCISQLASDYRRCRQDRGRGDPSPSAAAPTAARRGTPTK